MVSYESRVRLRNSIVHFLYIHVAKPVFFRKDPEDIHDAMTRVGEKLGGSQFLKNIAGLFFDYKNSLLEQDIEGIHFSNPIGLAAGFDKNARLTQILPDVGFGWMEVGTITARKCEGNPRPRLHRLPHSKALVVNYGLMNDGSDSIFSRIKDTTFPISVGTSFGPTNDEQTMDYKKAIEDYAYSYKLFAQVGSYTTLNLSCPNTCNDQPFTDPKKFEELLQALQPIRTKKPVFLKLSPDLSFETLDKLLTVAARYKIKGVICSNLTKKRSPSLNQEDYIPDKGGISGKPVSDLSDNMIKHIAGHWGDAFVIVGCGGVFTAEDAYRKIRLGASLIQMITGMIFEGPQVIGAINQGLVDLLKRDGFTSIKDVIGKDI